MISKKILELLRESKKNYFSIAELANYSGKDKATLKVILYRMVKQKELVRLTSGYYSLPRKVLDLEGLAMELKYPSYLSLEYALAIHGLLSQVPAQITLVTPKRSASYNVSGTTIEFSHLKPALFFGYTIVKQTQIARPEKALLDELYFIGLKKRTLNLEELDLRKINKNLLLKWLKLYPPSTAKLAETLGNPRGT